MSCSQPVWPDCRIDFIGGVPTLTSNGQPWFGPGLSRPILADHFEAFERLSGAGVRHFVCEATCTEDIYHPELRFWHGPGVFDGSAQDRYFSRLAGICKDALFNIRVYVGAPDWWVDAHPDQCQTYYDGSIARKLQAVGVRRVPSVASALWREEACEAMHRYVRWLIESGWSRRAFSFYLCYGITWEWGLLGSDGFLDYSEPMQQYFRKYLGTRYGTAEALSSAWGRPVDFAGAEIPSADRRARPGGELGLRHVPEFQDVIDYQQALSEANADLLLALAAAAKEASGRKLLIGTAYGYTLTAREHSSFTGFVGAGGFQGGHHALGKVLQSRDIDYLVSPFNYADRTLGSGLLLEHVPLASVYAHGKAFFEENDLYTDTGRPDGDFRGGNISIGVAETWEETVAYLRLSFGQAIVRGKHQWFAELAGWLGEFKENFSDPKYLAEVRHLNDRADELLTRDRRSVTELAFVLDEKSIAHLTLDHKGFLKHVYRASVSWGHTGAPFDLVLLEDLVENRCPPYRLVVPACVKIPESIDRLREWLERASARAWWDGTPEWYPPVDAAALIGGMEEAGVHRYIVGGATAWANASMVFIHVLGPGTRTIRFRQPCDGVEFFSNQRFTAISGGCDWAFEGNGTALFLID